MYQKVYVDKYYIPKLFYGLILILYIDICGM